jgi:hypothetical protein
MEGWKRGRVVEERKTGRLKGIRLEGWKDGGKFLPPSFNLPIPFSEILRVSYKL